MKEINDQLYGYSYELDTTAESDGTKCFAVDTGTVFVAYKGVWYEQHGSFWAASISEGEDDMYKASWEISRIVPASDLLVINAVDTGARYVSFDGTWYAQPVRWSAPAGGGGGGGSELPAVTTDDNGDVLTVVEGAWGKAAPSGGGGDTVIVNGVYDWGTTTLNKTWREIRDGNYSVIRVEDSVSDYVNYYPIYYVGYDANNSEYVVDAYYPESGATNHYTAASEDSYPEYTVPGG